MRLVFNYYYKSYSFCHRLESTHAKDAVSYTLRRKIFWEIKIFICILVFDSTASRLFNEMMWTHEETSCICFVFMIERNYSKHSTASENCESKSVLINHLVIIFKILSFSSNWRKSCVLTTRSMLSRVFLYVEQKKTMCFKNCLN